LRGRPAAGRWTELDSHLRFDQERPFATTDPAQGSSATVRLSEARVVDVIDLEDHCPAPRARAPDPIDHAVTLPWRRARHNPAQLLRPPDLSARAR
jgi:hypothetical protein